MEFTVLLPVYNKDNAKYLKQAIDSVLNQTIKPNEVLILVDGPINENLNSVLKNYQEKFKCVNIKYFDENRGLGKVLSDGVKLAKYELIARMDADDVALKHRFERQIKCFLKDERLTLVGSNIQEYSSDFKYKLKQRIVPLTTEHIQDYSKFRNPFNHMTVMFKKSCILEVGNYKEMPLFEDYYLWIRLIQKGYKTLNLPDVLVNVRAGEIMVNKRSGFSYFKKEINFQRELLRLRHINKSQYVRNAIVRGVSRLLPNKLLGVVYNKLLRK